MLVWNSGRMGVISRWSKPTFASLTNSSCTFRFRALPTRRGLSVYSTPVTSATWIHLVMKRIENSLLADYRCQSPGYSRGARGRSSVRNREGSAGSPIVAGIIVVEISRTSWGGNEEHDADPPILGYTQLPSCFCGSHAESYRLVITRSCSTTPRGDPATLPHDGDGVHVTLGEQVRRWFRILSIGINNEPSAERAYIV